MPENTRILFPIAILALSAIFGTAYIICGFILDAYPKPKAEIQINIEPSEFPATYAPANETGKSYTNRSDTKVGAVKSRNPTKKEPKDFTGPAKKERPQNNQTSALRPHISQKSRPSGTGPNSIKLNKKIPIKHYDITAETGFKKNNSGTSGSNRTNQKWETLARPFNVSDRTAKIAVVIYGLGNNPSGTIAAIQGLPGEVTLAFSPYATSLAEWTNLAHAASHEILLMVPPLSSLGVQTLLEGMVNKLGNPGKSDTSGLDAILDLSRWHLGVTYFPQLASQYREPGTEALLNQLKSRGLMYLESRPVYINSTRARSKQMNVRFAANTMFLDRQASRVSIWKQLKIAEQHAIESGAVIVMGFLYPVTLEVLSYWIHTLENTRITLAPVSAMAQF